MRTYPRNSPQAAARIVALAMLSDGHLTMRELDVLDRLDAPAQLGLGRADLNAVLHGFCDDLLASAAHGWADACRMDACTLAGLLAEVDDPTLRLTVLQLCVQVVEADDHLAEGESTLLVAAVEHWGLQHSLIQPSAPPLAA